MLILPTDIIRFKKFKERITHFIKKNRRFFILFLIIFIYALFYFFIDFSSQNLVAHDEGLYARRARLIVESDNWFSPPFTSPHHKTLGSYWFIALSIRLFGNTELALRLPSILSSFICLIISYLIALKITNKKSALISVFSLSTIPLWIQYSRYASPDLPFVLSILLIILFFIQSLESSQYIRKYYYIFFSGFFISFSFFIRSYMAFVPLIGLSPFICCNLYRKKYIFKLTFFSGILIGSIPTLLNFYFSVHKFGIEGITKLFDFASKQAFADFGLKNLFLPLLNFSYLTFPIGIIFIILIFFTKSNNKTNYPLLIYFYPLLSFLILVCMSTSYPHYYLFLLSPLSILFSVYFTSNSFRFSFSKYTIKYLLIILITIIVLILLFTIFNYKDLVIHYTYDNTSVIYIFSMFLLFLYFALIRIIFNFYHLKFNLINLFYKIVIPQYITISLLFNFGFFGNPNYRTKLFLRDKIVSSIINSNTVYLFGVDSKIETLLSYYLPSSKVVDNLEKISIYKYVITSDINSLDISDAKTVFKLVKKFDNHILFMKISK